MELLKYFTVYSNRVVCLVLLLSKNKWAFSNIDSSHPSDKINLSPILQLGSALNYNATVCYKSSYIGTSEFLNFDKYNAPVIKIMIDSNNILYFMNK